VHTKTSQDPKPPEISKLIKKVNLKFKIPKGKVAQIMGILNLLQKLFDNLQIEIKAEEGEISEDDFEDKIQEALMQLGIKLE